ncbi:tax1-binding protein 1 homolog isoform X2 [Mercenaria mercenaria]|uniref:tax1-binding protein 1 homolog isoform X2 n=1 Tax=Mercenaria mercenaria TaxID=6596 RepID=UPI001E1D794D|nr:tax1-binding protein 1 homolog isoform X2 [Mercenaria mercenaria]
MMSESEKEPVVIDEVVTLDTEGTEVKCARAEFATVVFHNIAETYPEDAHIECRYTVTSDLVPTTRDYVALYKVGWMSPRDYIYYEWAPIPKDYKVGCDADSSVMFPAHKLPKDDGEFYQFCYVSSSNQIRGASTPFQFRRPGADDFVEVEDEETNMLVIRSKTIYLEENLQQAQSQKQKLMEAQEALQKEKDIIISKYQEVKNQLVTMETECVTLKGRLSSSENTVEQLKIEGRDMVTVRDELQKKIDKLKKEQVTLNERINSLTADLDAANMTIGRVTDELKAKKKELVELQSEKDELSGKNAVLEEQAEMFKKHAETTETTVDQYSKLSETLEIKYAQQESLVDHLKRNVETLSAELEDNRQNLEKQTAVNKHDKERAENLEERLKNAEDKLMAAEESKTILQKEITTFEITQHEMSRQIEVSKTECESLKKKLVTLEEDFTQKTQIQTAEMEQTLNDVLSTVQEKEKLQKENSQLKQSLTVTMERSGESLGSMSIMKQSLTQIKERLEKKEKQYKGLEKIMRGREQDFLEREREMRREIEDLKEKIYMCGEEYKTLYLEKSKLQRKVHRMSNKRKSKSEQREKQEVAEIMVESETSQKSAPVSEADTEMGTSQDLVDEVEEFERDLDEKILKKEKYKKLYKEEQEKIENLIKKHADELQEKDSEIAKLKKRLREVPNEWDLKLRALEKCVTEKEMTIEDLNRKLRSCNQGRNDETGASMLPRGSGSPSQEGEDLSVLESTNGEGSSLEAPIRPLPAPLEPERLPSAKVAAVKSTAALDEPDGRYADAFCSETDLKVKLPEVPSAPLSATLDFVGQDTREDRFYDAEGSSMKICPDCNKTFPADVDDQVMFEHQVSHMGTVCPQCMMLKPEDMTDEDFFRHVNKHYEEEENGQIY